MKKKMSSLLFLCFFLISHTAYVQELKKVWFTGNEKTLKEALSTISEQSGYIFSYDSKKINPYQTVTIPEGKQLSLEQALHVLLPYPTEYIFQKNYIILKLVEEPLLTSLNPPTPISKPLPSKTAPLLQETDFTNQSFTNHHQTIEKNSSDLDSSQKTTLYSQKNSELNSGKPTNDCLKGSWNQKQEIMNKQTLVAIIGLSATLGVSEIKSQEIQKESNQEEKTKAFQLSFLYPIGTGGIQSVNNTYQLSINVLGGITGATSGLGLASICNINRYGMSGVELAGIANVGGKNVTGVQMSGICNIAGAESSPKLQIAGISNVSARNSSFQISGISNFSRDTSTVQIAGISNASGVKASTQIASIANYVDSASNSVQIAGIANIAPNGNVNTQISGIANHANDSKFQSGLVNMTRKGGFQLGLINIRDTADGLMLGLLNIARKGGLIELEVSSSEWVYGTLSLRTGTRRLYSIISLGFHKSGWITGAGLGTEIPFNSKLGINIELMCSQKTEYNRYSVLGDPERKDTKYNTIQFYQLRPVFYYSIFSKVSIFAGPSLNMTIDYFKDYKNIDHYKDIIGYPPTSIKELRNLNFNGNLWIGGTLGLRFKF